MFLKKVGEVLFSEFCFLNFAYLESMISFMYGFFDLALHHIKAMILVMYYYFINSPYQNKPV